MRVRLVLLTAATLAAISLTASAAGPAPQITDPAADANLLNGQAVSPPVGGPLPGDHPTPVGSQDYADVLSVTWTPTTAKKGKKTVVTGFTVTTVLSAPPVPPAGTSLVYRMLSDVKGDHAKYLGPVYYTNPADATPNPQSALRDNLGKDGATRLTPLALPKIAGSTMTWTVPLSAVPVELEPGTVLKNLYFEVRELESFHGVAIPDDVPSYGGATGLATGILDNGTSTSTFVVR